MSFTIGSLFDGSGGFPLAAFMCEGVPLWASEIEPYPIAVTKSRFPYMKHLGDVARVKGNEVEPVDVVSFGSPCQDLSVAGLRKGLKHENNGDDETTRSGLFMEAIRIIKEMREATNGRYPTFAVWENVPGAFSSNKGEDFRIVLEELIKIVEPTATMPTVPKNGWPYADNYVGDGWSLAYRVLDAQYWGVPQRRRRIYLVLDLRGERARKVLFEREGLRGYFEEGRTPWETVTADAERGVISDDSERNSVVYGICSYASNSMKSSNPNSGIYEADTSRTIDLNGGNPACNQGGMVVVQPVGFDAYNHNVTGSVAKCLTALRSDTDHIPIVFISGGFKEHNSPEARSIGYELEKSPTLSATKHDAAVAICYDARGNGDGQIAPTITGDHNNRVTDYTTIILDRAFYNQGQNALYEPQYYEDGIVPPIVAKGPSAVAYSMKSIARNGQVLTEQANPICACDYKDPDIVVAPPLYIVRRLTPTECARLQGFPDRWGHPDKKDDFTDEEYEFWLNVRNNHAEINGKAVKNYSRDQMLNWYNKLHTDSSEYKLWGNGIALPNALYVMQGIADVFN